jgi:hypothetical protein
MNWLKNVETTAASLVDLAVNEVKAVAQAATEVVTTGTVVPDDEKPCIDGRKEPRERKPLDLSKCKGESRGGRGRHGKEQQPRGRMRREEGMERDRCGAAEMAEVGVGKEQC